MFAKLPRRNPVFGVTLFYCLSVRPCARVRYHDLMLPFQKTPKTLTIKGVTLPFPEFKLMPPGQAVKDEKLVPKKSKL